MPLFYYRNDQWVQDALGNAISGAGVYVTAQPTVPGHFDDDTGAYIPPTPQVQVFADSMGRVPLSQPVIADGYGHAFFYVAPGIYTITTYSPRISQVTLVDQVISALVCQVNAMAPIGVINGVNVTFNLMSDPANYLMLFLNGMLLTPGESYSNMGGLITMVNAPQVDDQLFAVYQ